MEPPAMVTVHVWRLPGRALPGLPLRLAVARRTLRRLQFAKLLGSASGQTFAVRDFDVHRWVLVATWTDVAAAQAFEHSSFVAGWDRVANERWRAELTVLSARGRWGGKQPFGHPPAHRPPSGAIAAITRARLRPRQEISFRRAVPIVARDLRQHPGALAALGIGEAPVGLQGTFSLWSSADALRQFAYRSEPHRHAIEQTHIRHWYSEELFAQFAVVNAAGTLDGHDPLGSSQ